MGLFASNTLTTLITGLAAGKDIFPEKTGRAHTHVTGTYQLLLQMIHDTLLLLECFESFWHMVLHVVANWEEVAPAETNPR